MKVYFTAPLEGKEQYKEEYSLIVDTLKNHGAHVRSIFDSSIGLTDQSSIDKNKAYEKINRLLKGADLVVAEISYPSVRVGYEISAALAAGKPVLALRLAGTRTNVLEGHPDEKFKMEEYEKKTLDPLLEKWLKTVNDLADIRFNFFIPPRLVSYLDWISKARRIPRAVYLRGLIEKEMKSDRKYKEA